MSFQVQEVLVLTRKLTLPALAVAPAAAFPTGDAPLLLSLLLAALVLAVGLGLLVAAVAVGLAVLAVGFGFLGDSRSVRGASALRVASGAGRVDVTGNGLPMPSSKPATPTSPPVVPTCNVVQCSTVW
jgi:hypothetical protein